MKKIWNKIKDINNPNKKNLENSQTIESEQLFTLTEQDINIEKEGLDCSSENLSENDYSICYAKNYSKYFNSAIENQQVRNLAITGEYGVGKSSIFKSFLKNYNKDCKKYKNSFLEIEIGRYYNKCKNNCTNYEEYISNEVKYIQKQILIQISSQVKSKKIENSSYKLELLNISRLKIFVFVILVLAAIIFSTIFSIGLNNYLNNKTEIKEITSSNSFEFNWSIYHWNLETIIAFGVVAIIFIASIFVLISKHLKQINKISLSLFSQKIELEFDKKGVFQETEIRISEILYVFKKLIKLGKYIYVFEDLDSFDNILIFQKLKELNKIINNFLKSQICWKTKVKLFLKTNIMKFIKPCYTYPNKVIFVYLIRPNFLSQKQVKFFDLIIPIIPIISKNNANEFWIKEFKKIIKKENIIKQIENNWSEYFFTISKKVYDIRNILSILNEFEIYFNIFYSSSQNKENLTEIFKLLSFIIFKNIFYKEYISICNLSLKNIKEQNWQKKTNYLDFVWKNIEAIDFWKINIKKDKLNNVFKEPSNFYISLLKEHCNQYCNQYYYPKEVNIDVYLYLNYIKLLREMTDEWDCLELKFSNIWDNISDKLKRKLEEYFEMKINCKSCSSKEKISNYNNVKDENNKREKDKENKSIDNEIITRYNESIAFIRKLNEVSPNKWIIDPYSIFEFSSLDSISQSNISNNFNEFKYLKNEFLIKRLENEILYEKILKKHFEDKLGWENIVSKEIDFALIFLKLVDIDFKQKFLCDDLYLHDDDNKSLSFWFVKLLIYIENQKNQKIIQNIFWLLPPIGQSILLLCADIIYRSDNLSYSQIKEKLDVTFAFDNNQDLRNIKKEYLCELLKENEVYYEIFHHLKSIKEWAL